MYKPTRITATTATCIDNILTNNEDIIQSTILISDITDHFPTILSSNLDVVKGVKHPWTLFLKILNIFSKNRATWDKVSYGYGQRRSKELKNHSLTSAETIVVKLQ